MNMVKKLCLCSILLFIGGFLNAQTTTVSGNMVDADGTTWANGSWTVQFIPNPSNPNINVYNINGIPLSPTIITQKGLLSGVGYMSVSGIPWNNTISPSGSSWTLQICPYASAPCTIQSFTASTSTQTLTSIIPTSTPGPRFNAVAGAYGYANIEAILTYPVGGTYWSVTNVCQMYYSGSAWACSSGSGSTGTPSPPAFSVQIDNASNTGFASDSSITENPTLHQMIWGGPITGPFFNLTALSTIPVTWTFDVTTPLTALLSLSPVPYTDITGPNGAIQCLRWNGASPSLLTLGNCGNGTVTSVGATSVDSSLVITGSPITSLGSFTFTTNRSGTGHILGTFLTTPGSSTSIVSLDGSGNLQPYPNSNACASYASTSSKGCSVTLDGKWTEWVTGPSESNNFFGSVTVNLPVTFPTVCYLGSMITSTIVPSSFSNNGAGYVNYPVSCTTSTVTVIMDVGPDGVGSVNHSAQIVITGH